MSAQSVNTSGSFNTTGSVIRHSTPPPNRPASADSVFLNHTPPPLLIIISQCSPRTPRSVGPECPPGPIPPRFFDRIVRGEH